MWLPGLRDAAFSLCPDTFPAYTSSPLTLDTFPCRYIADVECRACAPARLRRIRAYAYICECREH